MSEEEYTADALARVLDRWARENLKEREADLKNLEGDLKRDVERGDSRDNL